MRRADVPFLTSDLEPASSVTIATVEAATVDAESTIGAVTQGSAGAEPWPVTQEDAAGNAPLFEINGKTPVSAASTDELLKLVLVELRLTNHLLVQGLTVSVDLDQLRSELSAL